MREPSIHIKEKDLIKILEDIIPDNFIDINWLVKELSRRSIHKAPNNRSVSVSNNKLKKDIKTLIKSSESDSGLLANLIFHIRRRKTKLYTSKKIEKGSKEYTQLKELTKICIDFCNTFDFNKKEGFTKYLELAIPKITSSLNYIQKLINMAEKIYQIQEAQLIIDNDKNSSETKLIHDIYVGLIATKTGLTNNYIKNPIVYCKFIEVREITDDLDIPIDIYIKAQFHGLSWTDSFPEPHQLIGDKSIERLNKYLYENKIRTTKVENINEKGKDFLMKLKDKYDNYRDKQ